jgi:hypothetical protein
VLSLHGIPRLFKGNTKMMILKCFEKEIFTKKFYNQLTATKNENPSDYDMYRTLDDAFVFLGGQWKKIENKTTEMAIKNLRLSCKKNGLDDNELNDDEIWATWCYSLFYNPSDKK